MGAKNSIYNTRKLLDFNISLRFSKDFWTHAVAIYDEARQKENTIGSEPRLLFRRWLQNETGIYTYYPTDWCVYTEAGIMDGSLSRMEFVRALYGVTLLALNNHWFSEGADCPEEWYEKKRIADRDAQNQANL